MTQADSSNPCRLVFFYMSSRCAAKGLSKMNRWVNSPMNWWNAQRFLS